MAGLGRTTRGAPEHLLGVYEDGRVRYGIEIPHLLSLLADHSWNATVKGLDAVPARDRPPVNVVRYAFQTMVGIGTLLALIAVVYISVRVRRRRLPRARWFYWALVAAGPLAYLAAVAGWITTEVGRQPWTVYGVMRTSQAVTDASAVPIGYATAAAVYVGLAAAVFWVLRRISRTRMLDHLPLILILIGLTAYAVLAGADFGSGIWVLFGPRRGGALRDHARHAMGPVWEANHVWLIFVLVVCWTAYPTAFASIASTLAIPLSIALIGIVLRGTAYALRAQTDGGEVVATWVNGHEAPLCLYIFAEDEHVVDQIVGATDSGDVDVNDCTLHPLIPELPFGGVGNSGMGKYHGRWGFEAFTNARGVLYHSTRIDPGVRYPPYSEHGLERKVASRLP